MKESKYPKIDSLNPLYLIINKIDGYFKEMNGNQYLPLVSTDKNKKVLTKYTELWDRIKNSIKKINKSGEYRKDFMKIKFNSDNALPLNETLKLHNTTIIVRSVFE